MRWSGLILLVLSLMIFGANCRCGERLERALDLMQQRGNSARRRYDTDDSDIVYREKLRSAPIEVSVAKVHVEIPNSSSSGSSNSRDSTAWAKVERCFYEPTNNSIRTRIAFNELAVTGVVRLVAHEPTNNPAMRRFTERLLPAESCRMSLRLRHAGMEFYTSPIARGRGQMRIRTESSFLEPRFASIYAYGCRPVTTKRPHAFDRIESEPRKRELAKNFIGLASNDYNSVSNSSTFADVENEDIDDVASVIGLADEENRLGTNTANDALLDNLWRSRGDIAREMEDVFLRSASQAITHYIERQLHPAIKETLMLSMGYTISYG